MSNKQIDTLSTNLRRIRKDAIDLFLDIALNAKERTVKADGLCLQRSIIESFDPQLYSYPKSASDVKKSLVDALNFRYNSLQQSSKTAVTVMEGRRPKIISLHQFCKPKPGSKTSYFFSEQEHLAAAVNLINTPMPGIEYEDRKVRPCVILVDRENEQLNFQVIFPEGSIDQAEFSGDILESGAVIHSHDSIHYDAIVPKLGNTFKFEKGFAKCFGDSLNNIFAEDFVTMDTIVLTDVEHDAKSASGGKSVWCAHIVSVNILDIVELWNETMRDPKIRELHKLLSEESAIHRRLSQVLAQASREAPRKAPHESALSANSGFGPYAKSSGSLGLSNDVKRAIRESIRESLRVKSGNSSTRKKSEERALSKLGWFGRLSKKKYSRNSRKVHPNSGRPRSPQSPQTQGPGTPRTPRTPRSRGLSRPRNNISKEEIARILQESPKENTTSNAAIAKAIFELESE